VLILTCAGGSAAAQDPSALEAELRARIARDTATVAVAYLDPSRREEVLIEGGRQYHAASTMKVAVLIELARQVDSGGTGWDDPVRVENRFHSIADSSLYQLNRADDSDSTLYELEGKDVSLARLARLMITRSSNLATNLIIGRLGPTRVNATAHRLGADSIAVLRGVEDGKAFQRGLNNTTTARDLMVLLQAIAERRAASSASTDTILAELLDQEFNDRIPAGLPPGVRVAHKTGEITGIAHDAAIVYPEGRGPYVLVILTRDYRESAQAARLMADLSALTYRWAMRQPDPHE
jgi:beta-lactamase class A